MKGLKVTLIGLMLVIVLVCLPKAASARDGFSISIQIGGGHYPGYNVGHYQPRGWYGSSACRPRISFGYSGGYPGGYGSPYGGGGCCSPYGGGYGSPYRGSYGYPSYRVGGSYGSYPGYRPGGYGSPYGGYGGYGSSRNPGSFLQMYFR